MKYSDTEDRLELSFLGVQVGRTRDIPPEPDTKPKLTGNLQIFTIGMDKRPTLRGTYSCIA